MKKLILFTVKNIVITYDFLTKEELDRTEWLVDVDDKLKDYDRYWTELKQKVRRKCGF